MIGQTVSHYRIVEHIGSGGMGVVYKAVDERLDRFVALKFLSAASTVSESRQRFMLEARSASALDHPNICTVHDIDETPTGDLFLAMAYYEGETLKSRIERGPLPVNEALDLARQLVNALSQAHKAGILHRDVKPANLIITQDGLVKVLDFGVAKLRGQSDVTKTGSTVGTVAYMSPEQMAGDPVDQRSDLWSAGVVLFEMLAAKRPFPGNDDVAVLNAVLRRPPLSLAELRPGLSEAVQKTVARALQKNPAARYQTAEEMAVDLATCRAPLADSSGSTMIRPKTAPRWQRWAMAATAAALISAVAFVGFSALQRNSRQRWAREQAIPEITRLVGEGRQIAALPLAQEAERYIAGDPALAALWPQIVAAGSLSIEPEGADVFMQAYDATDDQWISLGRTPLEDIRLPRGILRFRVEKAGFQPAMLAARNPGALLNNGLGPLSRSRGIVIRLLENGATPEMVRAPGGAFPVGLTGFNSDVPVAVDEFRIDRAEVTNKDYKEFVDRGGYDNEEHWRDLPFASDARAVDWRENVARFRDTTGRPGPATWELAEFPAGQANYPVGGVSWYEAAAYCAFRGKTLPTIYQWSRAALSPAEIGSPLAPGIIPLSNFGGSGPAAVGTHRGVGPYGTVDMAGNVREWTWNEAGGGRRWIPGGSWADPDYMFLIPASLPPFDRSPMNGFRCAKNEDGTVMAAALLGPVETYSRDHRTATPVSDEIYAVFKRQAAYQKSALNARVDARDEQNSDWIREKVSLDAGYNDERLSAALFLPRSAKPPFQVAVFFPGAGVFSFKGSLDNFAIANFDFLLRSGRALVIPAYKGSFERWDPFLTLQGEEYLRTYRERTVQWRHDVGRLIDALAARGDIDTDRIVYFGQSFGSSSMLAQLALEDRFKTAVLLSSGFTYRELPPESDAINYAPRVTVPVLMIGGRHDYIFPLETAQRPLFDRWGTPKEHKRHVVFEMGHSNFPRAELIREVLAWLDRYLGPIVPSS